MKPYLKKQNKINRKLLKILAWQQEGKAPEIKSAWVKQQAQGLLGQLSDTLQQNKVKKAKTNKQNKTFVNKPRHKTNCLHG